MDTRGFTVYIPTQTSPARSALTYYTKQYWRRFLAIQLSKYILLIGAPSSSSIYQDPPWIYMDY